MEVWGDQPDLWRFFLSAILIFQQFFYPFSKDIYWLPTFGMINCFPQFLPPGGLSIPEHSAIVSSLLCLSATHHLDTIYFFNNRLRTWCAFIELFHNYCEKHIAIKQESKKRSFFYFRDIINLETVNIIFSGVFEIVEVKLLLGFIRVFFFILLFPLL